MEEIKRKRKPLAEIDIPGKIAILQSSVRILKKRVEQLEIKYETGWDRFKKLIGLD